MICLLFASYDVIPENTTKQPIECWILTADRAKTHRHTDKRRNWFLKHKLVKQSFYRISITTHRNKCILIWRHAWRWFPKKAILKRSLNFFFLAFCGVISQNLLHRQVYIAVSSSKLLFRQFCEKPLHITFKSGLFARNPGKVAGLWRQSVIS